MIQPSLFERQDEFGNLIRDPVLTNPVSATRTGPTLDEGYYLLDVFNARVVMSTERTSLSVSAWYTERDYEESLTLTPQDSTDVRLASQITRKLRPQLSGFIGVSWRDHEEELSDYVQWSTSIGANYQLGPQTSLRFNIAHLERDASGDDLSYTENRASLGFDKRW